MSRERKIDMVILGLLNHEDHMYYYLTVTFGIDTYEAYLKWCAKADAMLKKVG